MNTYKRHRFPRLRAPQTSSATPSGSTIASISATAATARLLPRARCAGPFIEDLLAKRGITVSREAIRLWCIKFSAIYTRRLERKHRGYGDTFFIDEVFVNISGKQHYLWRAVDQDGSLRVCGRFL